MYTKIIFFKFLSFAIICLSTLLISSILITSAESKIFKIADIEISEPFNTNFNKEKVINKAFVVAFEELNSSIITTKDKPKVKSTKLKEIKYLIESFEIKNESFLDAMKRELNEETSIKNIKILKELEGWFKYELPENLIGIIWKGKYRGQKQKWYVVRFIGKTSEINLKTKNPEFIEWKWVQKEKLPKIIVDFKKHVYERLLIELKKII